MFISRDEAGNVTGIYANPQPDAVDGAGNVCPGVPTVEVPDDHPDVAAFIARREKK